MSKCILVDLHEELENGKARADYYAEQAKEKGDEQRYLQNFHRKKAFEESLLVVEGMMRRQHNELIAEVEELKKAVSV